ncbi:aminopeptidase P family protein [Francisella hispaniensis]|uniref:Xaa-Pro aminopeptidase n=1 Tax=Francisella hispaniensis FSC454 TaxID=1088883 RepID=A0AAC9NQ46_9GAMM|nr:aminopeptidase P family protein [Francisella hispaniensis]APD50712.1 Xaa-Pro aminopeptidase [Francisella hispaniensis FSC454]KYW82881.1 Xaa-Pro aminopeptidase [Francisella hispaniensis FSC454]
MSEKLQILRSLMQEKGYDFYIVPSVDDHNNEYVPKCWQYRAWISGFDGSAGDVLVGMDKAYLSTDGRYFLQAEQQLNKDEFELIKQSGSAPEIVKWLWKNAKGKTIAIDPAKLSYKSALELLDFLNSNDYNVVFDQDNLVHKAQQKLNQVADIPCTVIQEHAIQYSGRSVASKIEELRRTMKQIRSDFYVDSKLDHIAWLLNIRGRDVECTPLVISYLFVSLDEIILYVDDRKVTPEIKKYLDDNYIQTRDYYQFYQDLEITTGKYLLDGANINYKVPQSINKNQNSSCYFLMIDSPVGLSKALKNPVEINGAKEAHRKDAAAFISWWHWIENNYQGVDEIQAAAKLREFRAQQQGYVEDSFSYIVGHAANGAIIHYMAKKDANLKKIDDQAPLLCDSGGQYREGTTDITRVLHFGKPSKEHRRYYTLVLKGHLGLGRAVFPKDTTGSQLDVLAREHLWHFCADYAHGTGHGVGSFLGVHEGPQRINSVSKVELMPGMILSNEPGAYFPGEFGIRIENLCYVKQRDQESPTGHGPFYYFEDLTLVPYEYKLIETWMLTYTEKKTINNYYSRIRKEVLPLISDPQVREFLLFKTRHIK